MTLTRLSIHSVLLSAVVTCLGRQAPSQMVTSHSGSSEPVPAYRISFERRDPIPGIAASREISGPIECTPDGTAFLNMVIRTGPEQMSSSSRLVRLSPPIEILVSASLSGEAHEFRLDQLHDLHDVKQKAHYATDSELAILVIAAPEDKQGKESFVTSDGVKHEVAANVAERHDYLVIFDRDGTYRKTIQLDDAMVLLRVGVFASGNLLAFGFDRVDRSPKLALFNSDGSLLRFLEIPKGDVPTSMLRSQDSEGKGPAVFVAPTQFVPYRDSIIVVQNETRFPLLDVNEAGAVSAIKPKLPQGVLVDSLIPSDANLYALGEGKDHSIFELNADDGSVVRRLQTEKAEDTVVACAHDGKFLSFKHSQGKLVPLLGTTAPLAFGAPHAERPEP